MKQSNLCLNDKLACACRCHVCARRDDDDDDELDIESRLSKEPITAADLAAYVVENDEKIREALGLKSDLPDGFDDNDDPDDFEDIPPGDGFDDEED